jgi:hypothetical protein
MKGYLGGVQQVQGTLLPLNNLSDPPLKKTGNTISYKNLACRVSHP